MKKYFLALQALIVACMTILIACGHDGAITYSLVGIASSMFGVNAWALMRDSVPD